MRPAGILGTGSFVPERVVPNSELEKIVDTSDEWIRTRTGIRMRRYSDFPITTSDMCVSAAEKALLEAGILPEELDLIMVATVTPDMVFPATACLVQDRLGAKKAAAFDLEAGCSGFLYGMTIASQFISSGAYRYVLVIGAEILSRLLNEEDRTTYVLFGDGAGAAVMGPVPEGYGVRSFYLGSDGSGGDWLKMPAGGSLMPPSEDTVKNKLHTVHMQGREVFKFAVREMPKACLEALKMCGMTTEDVDFVIPHQANIRIIDAVLKRLEIPKERAYINLDRYGNISSASIPLALNEALAEKKIKRGDILLTVVFGAGLTWGASVLKWW